MRAVQTALFSAALVILAHQVTAQDDPVAIDLAEPVALAPESSDQVYRLVSPDDGVLQLSGDTDGVSWFVRPDIDDAAWQDGGRGVFAAQDDAWLVQFSLPDGSAPRTVQLAMSPEPFAEPNNVVSQAVEVEDGAITAFRLMPAGDRDVFALTARASGTAVASVIDNGGHDGLVMQWLREDGTVARNDWSTTAAVAAGETIYAEVRSDDHGPHEQGLENTVRMQFFVSPEPYPEPDDTPDTARAIAFDTETAFRLMPRWDRDVFAVTAPSDGAVFSQVSDTGGHGGLVMRWLRADGSEANTDWSSSARVAAGETVYAEFRSDDYYWHEVALADDIRFSVRFVADAEDEPGDTIATARPVPFSEPHAFRLMPQWDRDVFAVTADAAGAVVADVLDVGGHDGLVMRWLRADGSEANTDWARTASIAAGETLYAEFRSDDYYWHEAARADQVQVRFEFSAEPFAEPDNTLAQARPVPFGEEQEFRLMPVWDRDVFSVTADTNGAVSATVLEAGGHDGLVMRWLRADGTEANTDWATSATIAAGETLYAEFRSDDYYWSEVARVDPLRVQFDFSAEPFLEPDNTIAEARPSELAQVHGFRLMPRWDRDVFAVRAPENGAFIVTILDGGRHPDLRLRWLRADGTEANPDWANTARVATGEVLFAEVRSDDYYWSEVGLTDELQIRFDFTAEPFLEPDDHPTFARPLEIDEVASFRLMPQWDRDTFAVTAPQAGELVPEFLEVGGHGGAVTFWQDVEANSVSGWNEALPVTAGQTAYLHVRSDDYYWSEQALEDRLQLRVRLRLPDGRFLETERLPNELAFAPWQRLTVPAGQVAPTLILRSTDAGRYRLEVDGPSHAIRWLAEDGGVRGTGPEIDLAAEEIVAAEILFERREATDRATEISMSLTTAQVRAGTGPYPRQPPTLTLGPVTP